MRTRRQGLYCNTLPVCNLVGLNLCCNTWDCISIKWEVGWEEGQVTIQNLYRD